MTNYTITIVSDTVCPWCYVGHKRVKYAIRKHLQTFPHDKFTTTWKPYYLNPDSPMVGVPKREFYERKFGSVNIEPMFERLATVGKMDGINFKFGGKLGNTRNSHRLIEFARVQEAKGASADRGLQTKVVEELFKRYFEEEKDITDMEVLREAGLAAGLAESDVKRVLDSDEGGEAVDQETTEARADGVTGVPHFLLNNTYAVEGAQDPKAFEMLFRTIKDEEVA